MLHLTKLPQHFEVTLKLAKPVGIKHQIDADPQLYYEYVL